MKHRVLQYGRLMPSLEKQLAESVRLAPPGRRARPEGLASGRTRPRVRRPGHGGVRRRGADRRIAVAEGDLQLRRRRRQDRPRCRRPARRPGGQHARRAERLRGRPGDGPDDRRGARHRRVGALPARRLVAARAPTRCSARSAARSWASSAWAHRPRHRQARAGLRHGHPLPQPAPGDRHLDRARAVAGGAGALVRLPGDHRARRRGHASPDQRRRCSMRSGTKGYSDQRGARLGGRRGGAGARADGAAHRRRRARRVRATSRRCRPS